MPVGFKLPEGATTILGHRMDLSARPWGANGGSPARATSPDPNREPNAFRRWRQDHGRRYGHPHPSDPSVISFPGLEHPQFESALRRIAEECSSLRHYDWFASQGLGRWTGDTEPSLEEVFDAQAWSGRDRILAEGKRLFELDSPPAPTPTPLPPPWSGPPPASVPSTDFMESMDAREWARAFVERAKADPSFATDEGNILGWFANAIMRGYDEMGRRIAEQVPSLPPLSPLSVRVEELRSLVATGATLGSRSAVDLAVNDAECWAILRPFAVEALHFYRLIRRHLGDPRPLPEEPGDGE